MSEYESLLRIHDYTSHFLRHVDPELLSIGWEPCLKRLRDGRAWSVGKSKIDKGFWREGRYKMYIERYGDICAGIYVPDTEPEEEFWLHVNDDIFMTKISDPRKIYFPLSNILLLDLLRSQGTDFYLSFKKKRTFYAIYIYVHSEIRHFMTRYSCFIRIPGKDKIIWLKGVTSIMNSKDEPFSLGEKYVWDKYGTFEFKFFDCYASVIQEAFREYEKSELKWKRRMKSVFEEILWIPGGIHCELGAVRWKNNVRLQKVFDDPDYHKKRRESLR